MRLLITESGKKFILKEEDKNMHTNFGMISGEDIKKAKLGSRVSSNKGVKFRLVESSFIDEYQKLKRIAQIIPLKDIGLIITEAGLTKESIVIEAGAGSGALGIFLSQICKKVYSYEIREDFFKLVEGNISKFGIKNMMLKNRDAKEGFDEKNVDLVLLDLPSPWEFLDVAHKSLKFGGFLVSYSPTIPQVMDFVNNLGEGFVHVKTSEMIEREWEIKERKVRPMSQAIGHSGFLSFARKIS
ncbi:tRNA (adenine-N1)-methyltransferase [Candidatus Woesearchaeota archaeon]|nr:tRNA (adenine-N1)-methyltransferase [Candidatus Woesearchaeota archaeon]